MPWGRLGAVLGTPGAIQVPKSSKIRLDTQILPLMAEPTVMLVGSSRKLVPGFPRILRSNEKKKGGRIFRLQNVFLDTVRSFYWTALLREIVLDTKNFI